MCVLAAQGLLTAGHQIGMSAFSCPCSQRLHQCLRNTAVAAATAVADIDRKQGLRSIDAGQGRAEQGRAGQGRAGQGSFNAFQMWSSRVVTSRLTQGLPTLTAVLAHEGPESIRCAR